MATTVRHTQPPRPLRPTGSGPIRADDRLAALWHCSPTLAERRRRELPRWAADVAFTLRDEPGRLTAFLAELAGVLDPTTAPEPSAPLIHPAQVVDLGEDCAESAYKADPNPTTRTRWIHEIEAEIGYLQRLHRALKAEAEAGA